LQKNRVSLGTSSAKISYNLLEECLRQDLDKKAPRVMAILDPLKINLINLNKDHVEYIEVPDFPNKKEGQVHKIILSDKVFISREDFRMEDSPNYFRLAPNKIVRLKYAGLLNVLELKLMIMITL